MQRLEYKRSRGRDAYWLIKKLVVQKRLTNQTDFRADESILRKEVIQPQVPLRLPCYDLVPITEFALGPLLSCELRQDCWAPPTFVA